MKAGHQVHGAWGDQDRTCTLQVEA